MQAFRDQVGGVENVVFIVLACAVTAAAWAWRRRRRRQEHGATSAPHSPSASRGKNARGTDPHNHAPLHVTILALGTRGDVEPLMAVGLELKRRGCEVCLCSAAQFKAAAERRNLHWETCGIDLVKQQSSWLTARNAADFIRATVDAYIDRYEVFAKAFYEACAGVHRARPTDCIIVSNYSLQFGLDIAEALDVPCWAFKVMPDGITGDAPPFGEREFRFAQWLPQAVRRVLNKARYVSRIVGAVRAARAVHFTKRQDEFRERVLALPPVTLDRLKEGGPMLPTVFGYSPTLLPPRSDAPAWHKVVGFFFPPVLDELPNGSSEAACGPSEGQVSGEVDAFLGESSRAGRGVVCVAFGSMAVLDVAGNTIVSKCVEAALALEQRCLVVKGWTSGCTPALANHPDVLQVESIPYELLFPRVACVVHHGGAGTVAQCVRAGVPSVVVPVLRFADQAGWGNAVHDLGIGAHVLEGVDAPQRSVLDSLRAGLEVARNRGTHLDEFRRLVRAERGTERAVEILFSRLEDTIPGGRGPRNPDEERMCDRNCLVRRYGGGRREFGGR